MAVVAALLGLCLIALLPPKAAGADGQPVVVVVDRADPVDESLQPPDNASEDVGGTTPLLIAFVVMVGLWCWAWRIGPDHQPKGPPGSTPDADIPSAQPMRIRL
ncbi:MAG TPA: hypothetical protein VGJ86_25400 [Acidimicrobiales bacterium]